jgi:hypothetical protein
MEALLINVVCLDGRCNSNVKYMHVAIFRFNPQKLALTSSTIGGRSVVIVH